MACGWGACGWQAWNGAINYYTHQPHHATSRQYVLCICLLLQLLLTSYQLLTKNKRKKVLPCPPPLSCSPVLLLVWKYVHMYIAYCSSLLYAVYPVRTLGAVSTSRVPITFSRSRQYQTYITYSAIQSFLYSYIILQNSTTSSYSHTINISYVIYVHSSSNTSYTHLIVYLYIS